MLSESVMLCNVKPSLNLNFSVVPVVVLQLLFFPGHSSGSSDPHISIWH